MKPLRATVFTLLVFAMPLTAQAATAHAAATSEERLDIGGIVKEIEIPEGQPWAHVRVQAVINASPAAVWPILVDIERWPKWMPMAKRMRILSPEAAALVTPENFKDRDAVIAIELAHPRVADATPPSGHWQRTIAEEYDLPFPLKNEWTVRRYTYDEQGDTDKAAWRKVDGRTEDVDDGSWEISPWRDGRTLLTYDYRVKAKEGVPRPIFKAAVSLTVNSMMKALRFEAARRVASPAS